ncbi:MAG TPA: antitoxin VbhA family protein [Stellaceae bacterium]|nr:antitoxin VbhA family protein [Stellaceae bacterium]
MSRPTPLELAGRAEWLRHALDTARSEGRTISVAERAVMDRYAAGEISGDDVREQLLRLFETPELS